MRHSLHNRLCPLRRILTLENPASHKNPITTQLHHQRRIRRRRHPSCSEIYNRQPPQLSRLLEQIERRSDLLGHDPQFHIGHVCRFVYLGSDGPHVTHGFYDISRTGFAFGADHGGAFGDAAEGFAEVAAAAYEGHGKGVLFDVVVGIGWSEDFGFVDVVDTEGFEDLNNYMLCQGKSSGGKKAATKGIDIPDTRQNGLSVLLPLRVWSRPP